MTTIPTFLSTSTPSTPTPSASGILPSAETPSTVVESDSSPSSQQQAPLDSLEKLDQKATVGSESNFVVNEFIQQQERHHSPVELTMSTELENLKLEDPPDGTIAEKETSPAPTPPLPVISTPSPAQVFAPRPVRPPWPLVYRPIPQRLQKPLVLLEESPIARTPSPNSVTSPASPTSTTAGTATGVGGGLVQAATAMHRRSSSASIVGTDAGVAAAWNVVSMRLTEPRLAGGETSEVQVCVNDESGKERAEKEGMDSLMQLYSPSKDVLDELYKIIRNNKPYAFNINQLSTNSPLYRATSPLVYPRAMTPQQKRERGLSDSPSSPLRELTRSPAEWAAKIPFPSSPISRTAMRNPIIYNPQFAQATEQLGGL